MPLHHVLTWFLVADVDVEGEDDEQGDEGGPPVDDKHHNTTQDGPSQRNPHVVVFKARSPPCGGRENQKTREFTAETVFYVIDCRDLAIRLAKTYQA